MKALNDTQKKWLLTASLASLLSLNLVMNLSGQIAGSSDYASSTDTFVRMVNTPNGTLKAQFYTSSGGKKTRVIYTPQVEAPATGTESGVSTVDCKDCATDEVILNVPFDPKAINAIVMAAQNERTGQTAPAPATDSAQTQAAAPAAPAPAPAAAPAPAPAVAKAAAPAPAPDKDELGDDDKPAAPKTNAKLESLKTKCEKESSKDDKLVCYGNGLARVLKGNSNIEEDSALLTWQERVQKNFIRALGDTDPKNRGAHEVAMELMNTMMTGIDSDKYDKLRKTILLSATQAVANKFRTAQLTAETSGFTQEYVNQVIEADQLRVQLGQSLKTNIAVNSDDVDLVKKGYVLPSNAIAKAMKENKHYATIPEVKMDVYDGKLYSMTPGEAAQAENAARIRRAAQKDLERLKINALNNNGVTPQKTGDGAPQMQGNGGPNGGNIRMKGPVSGAAPQGQPGAGLPPAPGGIQPRG
jgi:hypothetical protein